MVSLSQFRQGMSVPVAVVLLAVAGLVTAVALGLAPRPTLLRAGFTVLGALVALGVFAASRGGQSTPARPVPPGNATKLVVALSAAAVLLTAALGSRLLPFAVVLPAGFALVAVQLRRDPSVPAVLTQLCALFVAPRLGKYLSTGFYYGGTDTFAHVAAVDLLVEARYTPAIPHGYDLYPVFHFFVGAVTHFTGLPAYDALVLTGIGLFTLLVPLAYLLGSAVFGDTRMGLLTALAVTIVEFFAYHAVYFYPQALAVVLIAVGLYTTRRLADARAEGPYRHHSVFALALVATMVVTHHLTYLLFAAVVAAALPVLLVRARLFHGASIRETLRYRYLFPGFVGALLLLTYWAYSPSRILVGIVELTAGLVFDVVAVPTARLFTYGAVLPVDTLSRAVAWLLTPTGLYATGLSALLLLAGYELLDDYAGYRRGFTLTVTGLGLSALLLPLPVPIPQIERLKFVVSLLALLPLAVGLRRVLAVESRYAVASLLVLATLGGATAFTVLAADDMENVYIDERREQVSMSDTEFRSVGTASAFLRQRGNGTVATDRVTNRAFETNGFNATRALRAEAGGLGSDATYLVARERWTDHVVALGAGVRTGDLNRFAVGQRRFEAAGAMQNRIYTTDSVRVYRSEDGYDGLYGSARNNTARNRHATE
ncbi:hypothetical protein [Haloarcula sediminis]|uniref:hypothetical protein n=1 Tax=Haloarcula sediminis TaxID=3111777 RepID=UPI002D78988A|nr:hypothetical protein [Haloarcula sp. CK38]